MNVVIDDELLVESASVSPAVTVAVLASWPCAEGVTTIVMTAVAPTDTLPILQLTVVVPLHAPCVGVEETKATPAGSGSLTVTFVAAAGPLFVTAIL